MADVTQIDAQQPVTSETEFPLLTITPVATEKVRALMAERQLEGFALRVFVQGGDHSGLSYGMAFEETIYEQDRVVESDGVRLVIDPTSLSYMAGSEIDFVDSLLGSGFAINNPNALSTCGCGHSHTDEEDAAGHSGSCGCGRSHADDEDAAGHGGGCGCGRSHADDEDAAGHSGGCGCGRH
ncbi:MAG: iron-sulfur cluster assembly accessory protein [Anaerolineae bacterium]|nr:iron-sulfur cluster assembly accessory protein [Anaerolineae bacterium]